MLKKIGLKNIILVSRITCSILSAENPGVTSLISAGVKIIRISEMVTRVRTIALNIPLANRQASFLFSSARREVKTGIKAALKAPNIRRL